MDASWPWLMLAALGIFHGLNPAMGWLFAVALGLHRGSRAVVVQSLVPLALGHALSIGIVATAVVAGTMLDGLPIRIVAGVALLVWGGVLLACGSRHRVRIGMRTGYAGLALWSFLMATAHGSGLMLLPALIPLCRSTNGAGRIDASDSALMSLAAVGVHTLSMLIATGAVAVAVYQWIGVDFLRRGWINLDPLWIGALFVMGIGLLAV